MTPFEYRKLEATRAPEANTYYLNMGKVRGSVAHSLTLHRRDNGSVLVGTLTPRQVAAAEPLIGQVRLYGSTRDDFQTGTAYGTPINTQWGNALAELIAHVGTLKNQNDMGAIYDHATRLAKQLAR